VFVSIKHRPIIIAERHNASSMTYAFYLSLKNNPDLNIHYCLFEGALDSKTHVQKSETAFKLYWHIISQFIKSDDTTKIQQFLHNDLQNEHSELREYGAQKIDKKTYPHGFGQIRNLSVHFLLYQVLKTHKTEWVAVDDKRSIIKKFAEQKIIAGTAYLYKQHKNIGNITTLAQKTLLEAAPIRSKYMSDRFFDYATKGQVIGLIGNRHALDITHYTPDLADIFGFNPNDDSDTLFYAYQNKNNTVHFEALSNPPQFQNYYRPVTLYNTHKLKSNFCLKGDYLNFLSII
jgi:hypothetical protein